MSNVRSSMTDAEFERFVYVIGVHQLPSQLAVELYERFVRLLDNRPAANAETIDTNTADLF